MSDAPLHARLDALAADVRREADWTFARWRPRIIRRSFLASAHNLAAYLALRRRDLRPLQRELQAWGLSSLGRAESRVLPSLEAVRHAAAAIAGRAAQPWPGARRVSRGERRLAAETAACFGAGGRHIRIMVTLPDESADDPMLVAELVRRGMDCARLNAAHGDPAAWRHMAGFVRAAALEQHRPVRVLMDLGGPKLRLAWVYAADPRATAEVGDMLLLSRRDGPTPAAAWPLQAGCAEPAVLDALREGSAVAIDDGTLLAAVERVVEDGVVLRVLRARGGGKRLKAAHGLNFPGTALDLPVLGPKDLADLDVALEVADLIGLSFVQSAADIATVQRAIAERRPVGSPPALVAKIETRRGVEQLPEIIVQAAGRQPLAVMIARGDLAVEVGWERLAELQEEILWVCEAAHVPVIWATQVLERLVKEGIPSRAEITDAAMAERAECVMLNKGPHLPQAITLLDDVLQRMEAHQLKKSPRLRALGLWRDPA